MGGGAKGAEGEQPPSGAEGGPSAPAAEPTEPAAPSALPTKSAPVIPETPAPADLDNDEMTYEAFRDAVNEAEVESGVDETEDHSHVGSKEHHINYASVSCGAQVSRHPVICSVAILPLPASLEVVSLGVPRA